MGFYHLKNIKIEKRNNKISADLADSNWEPIEYKHYDDFCCGDTFEEKYANFIYNVVCGNYHPVASNKYDRIMMNGFLHNYYQDAHDIGEVETYRKYKEVIESILKRDITNCVRLESDRKLNPERYYVLNPLEVDCQYKDMGLFYQNIKGELYCLTEKGLMFCSTEENNYGYPYYLVDNDEKIKFETYNEFLNNNNQKEMEL